jgi:hypothetical protein
VELEGNIIPIEKSPFIRYEGDHQLAEGEFRNIFSRFYFDDNKPEFPSDPYPTLGELADHLAYVIQKCLGICEEEKWIYSLLGNYPYYDDFCSGHIHTSLKGMSPESWVEMSKILFNAQPLIALLSANSPIFGGVYRASDVRLAFSSWSRFTEFGDSNGDHWMALAKGENGDTLECRIPSSSPLFQIIGIAGVIRLLLEDSDNQSLPVFNNEEIYERVVMYGSRSVIPIYLPSSITYSGIKTKKVYVPITELWRSFYTSNKDRLKEILEDVSATLKKEVFDFYETVAEGNTVSDKILEQWNRTEDKSEYRFFVQKLTKDSYNLVPIINSLPNPGNDILPKLEDHISIEEFKDIIDNLKIEDLPSTERFIDLMDLLVDPHMKDFHNIITAIQKAKGSLQSLFSSRLVNKLLMLDVVKEDELTGNLIPSKNFLSALQLLEDAIQ